MDIYLLRHGAAEDTPPGRSDADRRLTDEGRRKTAAVVRLAMNAGLKAPAVISSPYARAVETAQIASAELGLSGEPVRMPELVPYSSPEAVWKELRDYRDEEAILLAGHEPLLSQLAAYLLNAPALLVEMKKSTLLRIEMTQVRAAPRGLLRWMITAQMAEQPEIRRVRG